MQYQKIVSGKYLIELHNSWTGEESVFVNGQLVSKKYSVWGTNHYFVIMEGEQQIRFILTTKVNQGMQVMFDVSRNGALVSEDVPLPYGTMPEKPHLELKRSGLNHLKEFDLELAIEDFTLAVEISPEDPELYFYMACAYSVLEQPLQGFECLKKAVEAGLQGREWIATHDMLAYLRMHPAFEDFKASKFTRINKELLQKEEVMELV